jgi:hypothetical protein
MAAKIIIWRAAGGGASIGINQTAHAAQDTNNSVGMYATPGLPSTSSVKDDESAVVTVVYDTGWPAHRRQRIIDANCPSKKRTFLIDGMEWFIWSATRSGNHKIFCRAVLRDHYC